MELSELPALFQGVIAVEPEYGCWRWSGPETPTGYPVYKRKAAWIWAYNHVHGELPKGQYPVIEACHGPVLCANPNHRIGLPIDQAQYPHRCSVCRKWHDPDEEYSPPVATEVHRTPPSIIPRTKRFKITSEGLRDTTGDSDLTPEQQALEDMMDDSRIGDPPD